RDLTLGPILKRRLDLVGDPLERADPDRALLARLEPAADELVPLAAFAAAGFLHDHVRNLVDPLVAREAPAALETLAPPANDLAFLALAQVDNLVAEVSTVRTLHGVYSRIK